ncbi:MAG: hypothetical protein CMO81_02235 [Waddliaceae bacterium]|nr:hypothetical protein [Waddliaceae bacterium]
MPLSTTMSDFATYCRSGENIEKVPISEDKAELYRELSCNIVFEALNTAYPIAKRSLGHEQWDKLIRRFYAEAPSPSPHLWYMPKALIDYVEKHQIPEKVSAPYLLDLLHFEWLEIEVYMMPDQAVPLYTKIGDLLENGLVLNREHILSRFTYPVFRKKKDCLTEAANYFLITYRHPETLQVHYFEVPPVYVALVELLKQDNYTGKQVLEFLIEHYKVQSADSFMDSGYQFLKTLMKENLILGFSVEE